MNDINRLFIILSYKRPIALQECIRTVFNNTSLKPDLVYILDDASGADHQASLFQFAQEATAQGIPVNLLFNSTNMGIGNQFQTVYRLIEQINPKIAYIIEGDYYFRNQWTEDIEEMFELCPHTIACPLVDHADMYKREKTHEIFPQIMRQYFGRDIKARKYLYDLDNLIKLETNRGPMEAFAVSNSCGAQALHWRRIQEMVFQLDWQETYWKILNDSFHENGNRKIASDGGMSSLHSMLFDVYAENFQIDISKNFAYVNILPSVGFHACNGGVNGQLNPHFFPEGKDFPGVNSGTFPQDYNNWRRAG